MSTCEEPLHDGDLWLRRSSTSIINFLKMERLSWVGGAFTALIIGLSLIVYSYSDRLTVEGARSLPSGQTRIKVQNAQKGHAETAINIAFRPGLDRKMQAGMTEKVQLRPTAQPRQHTSQTNNLDDQSQGREFNRIARFNYFPNHQSNAAAAPLQPHKSTIGSNTQDWQHANLLLFAMFGVLYFSVASDVVLVLASKVSGPAQRTGTFSSFEQAEETQCRTAFEVTVRNWHKAKTVVMQLEGGSPLRALLIEELSRLARSLATELNANDKSEGAVVRKYRSEHWSLLRRRLRRASSDIERISATARAACQSNGVHADEHIMPTTRIEALHVLGANPDVDDQALQRLVKALRQCWHPDLARNDNDREYRGVRLAQINVANDLLMGRRQES